MDNIELLKATVMAKQRLVNHDAGTSGVLSADAALMSAYHNVFSGEEGLSVLTDLLEMLRFTQKGEDLTHMAMHNVALEILTRCGVGSNDIVRRSIRGD